MSTPTIVLVHGIRPKYPTFVELRESIERDPERRFKGWTIVPFPYDWELGVEKTVPAFVNELQMLVKQCGESGVFVIAHSMGGLVARCALMSAPSLRIRRLVMLATPNFGAISTAQQGFFWQCAFGLATSITGIYPRLQAYNDLMHVHELMNRYRNEQVDLDCEYATLPAQYYHATRSLIDRLNFASAHRMYAAPAAIAEFFSTVFPMRLTLNRPHDGIVESVSVSLSPAEGGARWSEKRVAIRTADKTYINVTLDCAINVDHGTILKEPAVLDCVKDILAAESLEEWIDNAPHSKLNVTFN
jgi:pimeloyl-ACP methyl ester carboxylesterase